MTPIPDGKVIIWRGETNENSEAIKIVDRSYELREDPYDEYYLDDLEESHVEQNYEAELIHPDDMEEDVNDGDDIDGDDNDNDSDDDRCDCCGEYWHDCQCTCSNCSNPYCICRANCYG